MILAAFVLAAVVAPGLWAQPEPHQHDHGGPAEELGSVHFLVSCSPAAQKELDRAVAMLHSFWYENAEASFTKVTQIDSGCAMGYWGIAMSIFHVLWDAPTAAGMEKGHAAVEKAKAIGAKTDRERDYIAAIETYYKDANKVPHLARRVAYEKAMEQVYLRYPTDLEAAAFYAIALVATAPPTDKTYANQKKAAAILDQVFAAEPYHPGVTHYFIHAYDSPALASLALPAARNYAKIAPSVPHALHMPSHIFTRLGLWQDSIQSNLASQAAAKDFAARTHMGGAWDQQLHAMDYLTYAYLQGSQDREANAVLTELRAVRSVQAPNFAAAYALAAIPARYALERRQWGEAAALEPPPSWFPWSQYAWGAAITEFARALGAARSGHPDASRKDLARLEGLHQALVNAKDLFWAHAVEVQRRAAASWIAHAEGQDEEALNLMRSAADLEDTSEKSPVTPGAVLPARELLGDLLVELRRPGEALHQYEVSLQAAPNRFNGLYGAARAARLSGDREKAKMYVGKLVELARQADGDRPELKEAKTLLAKN